MSASVTRRIRRQVARAEAIVSADLHRFARQGREAREGSGTYVASLTPEQSRDLAASAPLRSRIARRGLRPA